MCKKYILPLVLTLIFVTVMPLEANWMKSDYYARDQKFSEKGLEDNAYFIYFINPTVSNLGNDEDKKLFKEIMQRDLLSRFLYMRFKFDDSYKQVRLTQEGLIKLYNQLFIREIEISQNLLEEVSPIAINSANIESRNYLNLGFRHLKHAQVEKAQGDSYVEGLYSMKLYKYVRAFKKAKYTQQYAIMAMAADHLTKYDTEKFARLEFSKRLEGIVKFSPEDKKEYYRLIFMDSEYFCARESYYNIIWNEPKLNELEDYRKYLETKE